MSIISNERTGEKSKYSITSEGKVVRAYTHTRRVKTDVDYDTAEVSRLLGYTVGQPFSSDSASLLLGMDIDRKVTKSRWYYDVTLSYTTECPAPENDSEDPTQQRVKREWQTSEQTLYIVKDRDGNLIVNKAKQPFDGGIPVTVELPTLVYERNESSFNGSTATLYANSLNRYAFSGADKETLKLKISAVENFQGKYIFWAVKYEMAYFPLGWQPQPINAGLMQLVSSKLVPCWDRNRQPVTSPVPLDKNGLQIPPEDLPGAANFIKVNHFPLIDFSSLGLPPT